MATTKPNLGGRPSAYTPEIGDEICEQIANGKSLVNILKQDGMPTYTSVMRWLVSDREEYKGFREMYTQAREHQADYLADEILEIADDGSRDTKIDQHGNERCDHEWVHRSRLRVDTRKWIASKLKPRKYSDRLMQELSGVDGKPIEMNLKKAQEMTDDELLESLAKKKLNRAP